MILAYSNASSSEYIAIASREEVIYHNREVRLEAKHITAPRTAAYTSGLPDERSSKPLKIPYRVT